MTTRLLYLVSLLVIALSFLLKTEAEGGLDTVKVVARPTTLTWNTVVDGIDVTYRIIPASENDDIVGVAFVLGNSCYITINDYVLSSSSDWFAKEFFINVASHEFGHCVDRIKLNGSSNGFTDEGCRWNTYFCDPAEGYAEGYSYYYVAHCGVAAKPLGLNHLERFADEVECQLPDPEGVLAYTMEGL